MDFSCKQTRLHSHRHAQRFCPCGCFHHWGLAIVVTAFPFSWNILQSSFGPGVARFKRRCKQKTYKLTSEDRRPSVLFSHLQGVDVTEGGGWFDIWLTSRVPPVCTLTDAGQYRAAEILTGSKQGESGTLNKVDVLSRAASCDDPHCSGVARGLTPRLFFLFFLVTGTLFFYLLVRSAEQHHSFAYSWKWISLISAKSHTM